MDDEMREKLDKILDEVIDYESGLSINELGLVAGIKHNTIADKLIVYIKPINAGKAYSMVYHLWGYGKIEKELREALQKEFPYLRIEFKNT